MYGYGHSELRYRPLGCFGWIGALLLGSLLATIVGMMLVGFGVRSVEWVLVTWVAVTACVVAVTLRINRKMTTYRVFWCAQCGVVTDPRFRVCRSCGRVKN